MYDGYRYRGREIAPPQKKKIPSPIHDTKKAKEVVQTGKSILFRLIRKKSRWGGIHNHHTVCSVCLYAVLSKRILQ